MREEEKMAGDVYIKMYAAWDAPELQQQYESLLKGSRNQLRSFVSKIEDQGVVYEAQVLTREEVDSPIERDS